MNSQDRQIDVHGDKSEPISCILGVYGDNLDIDTVVQECLVVPRTWRRGQLRNPNSKKVYATSGMSWCITEDDTIGFEGQINEAIAFLKKHVVWLQKIRDRLDVGYMEIDFGLSQGRRAAVVCPSYPPELLTILGALRIELMVSFYSYSTEEEL